MEMIYLTYVSDFTRELEQQDFDDILVASVARNAELNITGFLVVINQHFFQALEGPKDNVLTVLGSILLDNRHHHLRIIGKQPSSQRDFPDWNMGFHNDWDEHLLSDVQSVLMQYAQMEKFTPQQAQSLRLLLQSFR